jgi:WD40 repeat protein
VRLWETETGKEIQTLKGHTGPVQCVAFSPDGKQIVSCGETLKLWDLSSGQETLSLRFQAISASFTPDGKKIMSGARDGTVKIWDASKASPDAGTK